MHCSLLLIFHTSKQELLLTDVLFHILFYVQLYINVKIVYRESHLSTIIIHKIVKLGLPITLNKSHLQKILELGAGRKKSGKHNSGFS